MWHTPPSPAFGRGFGLHLTFRYALTMIRQIALALLALFLTLPAAAAPLCHQPPVVAATVDHAGMDHAAMGHTAPSGDERETPPAMAKQHGCLGCAAPMAAAPAIAMIALPPLAAPIAPIDQLEGLATAPALPPPRI